MIGILTLIYLLLWAGWVGSGMWGAKILLNRRRTKSFGDVFVIFLSVIIGPSMLIAIKWIDAYRNKKDKGDVIFGITWRLVVCMLISLVLVIPIKLYDTYYESYKKRTTQQEGRRGFLRGTPDLPSQYAYGEGQRPSGHPHRYDPFKADYPSFITLDNAETDRYSKERQSKGHHSSREEGEGLDRRYGHRQTPHRREVVERKSQWVTV